VGVTGGTQAGDVVHRGVTEQIAEGLGVILEVVKQLAAGVLREPGAVDEAPGHDGEVGEELARALAAAEVGHPRERALPALVVGPALGRARGEEVEGQRRRCELCELEGQTLGKEPRDVGPSPRVRAQPSAGEARDRRRNPQTAPDEVEPALLVVADRDRRGAVIRVSRAQHGPPVRWLAFRRVGVRQRGRERVKIVGGVSKSLVEQVRVGNRLLPERPALAPGVVGHSVRGTLGEGPSPDPSMLGHGITDADRLTTPSMIAVGHEDAPVHPPRARRSVGVSLKR